MIKHFFTNSSGILISRIFGFIRDLCTAAILGAGLWSDIFFVAFKLPNLFRRLFAEGAFTQAFLPNFVKSNKKGVFCAEILLKFLGFILLLTLVVILFAPLFTKILAYGFDENTINLATPLVRINFFYLAFIFVVTLFASMLQYKGHFATTAFSTILLNISMICALLLANAQISANSSQIHAQNTQREISPNLSKNAEISQDNQKIAAYYLSYGVVIGGFLQLLAHIIAMKRTKMLKLLCAGFTRLKNNASLQTHKFWRNFYHGVLGSSSAQISAFIDTWFASFLVSGSISYLYYANRIFQLPYALFAIALTTAIFPKISKQIKANADKNAIALMNKSFHFLFAVLLFATIFAMIFADEIIWLLFQRGEFMAQNTHECAKVLCMFMLGLVPFGLSKLFSLWLYAKFQQKIAAKIALKSLLLNLFFCFILFKPLGASGLALSSSLCAFYLLFANLRIFSFNNFLAIMSLKKISLILSLCALEIAILLALKGFISAYI